jgi:hypothetical protein
MTLNVASGTSETVAAGDTLYAEEVFVDGELNVDGELRVDDASASASGTLDTSGTATSNRFRKATASGIADFSAALPYRRIDAGEVDTISAGTTATNGETFVGGELNVDGEYNVGESTADANASRFTSATGDFDATGTASAEQRKFTSASGDADFAGTANAVVVIPVIRRETYSVDYSKEDETITLDSDDAA